MQGYPPEDAPQFKDCEVRGDVSFREMAWGICSAATIAFGDQRAGERFFRQGVRLLAPPDDTECKDKPQKNIQEDLASIMREAAPVALPPARAR